MNIDNANLSILSKTKQILTPKQKVKHLACKKQCKTQKRVTKSFCSQFGNAIE